MNELVIVVEGETEQTFVRDQLAAHLAVHGTSVWAMLPGRHRNRGGVKRWRAAQQDMVRTLKERRFCSMMIDYYAMPEDWPGRVEAQRLPWNQRAACVEQKIGDDIAGAMGGDFDPKYFIPYVQLHEFEALVFADIEKLVSVLSPISKWSEKHLQTHFSKILDEAGHPEAIDDGRETCPSRRISGKVKPYRKRVHGPIATGRIGLEKLREKCNHFASWLARLESIGAE